MKERSRYDRAVGLLLLLLLRVGLLLRDLKPLLLRPRPEIDRVDLLGLDADRGDTERRGGDLVLDGVCAFAQAELCCLERVRPRSGDEDGILCGDCGGHG